MGELLCLVNRVDQSFDQYFDASFEEVCTIEVGRKQLLEWCQQPLAHL